MSAESTLVPASGLASRADQVEASLARLEGRWGALTARFDERLEGQAAEIATARPSDASRRLQDLRASLTAAARAMRDASPGPAEATTAEDPILAQILINTIAEFEGWFWGPAIAEAWSDACVIAVRLLQDAWARPEA